VKIKIKKEKDLSIKDLKTEKWLSEFELELTNTGDSRFGSRGKRRMVSGCSLKKANHCHGASQPFVIHSAAFLSIIEGL
jgi:hypothetical protein